MEQMKRRYEFKDGLCMASYKISEHTFHWDEPVGTAATAATPDGAYTASATAGMPDGMPYTGTAATA